jgi:hypothetical protein
MRMMDGASCERRRVHFLRESDITIFERIRNFEGKPINF